MTRIPKFRIPPPALKRGYATMTELRNQIRAKDGVVLDNTLPNESNPSADRAAAYKDPASLVRLHKAGDAQPFASAFLCQPGTGSPILISCAHVFSSSDSPVHLTSAGRPIGSIESLLTCSLLTDLILLKPSLTTTIPTLPISPYPTQAPVGLMDDTKLCKGRIVDYRTRDGREAQPGTYDDLFSMLVDVVPSEGMSGGPIIDLDSGAVVGIIRGNSYAYGDRRGYGFGTPAEHLWNLFELLQKR